jgi:hypothetical protein
MKPYPLEGVLHKIIRAEEHSATIRADLTRHNRECGFIGKKGVYPDYPNMITFYARFPSPDMMLSVVIGECLHDLRSALDHLVWQLVEINPNPPVDLDKFRHKSQFPICDTSARFQEQVAQRRLYGVLPNAITLIEGLQPYRHPRGFIHHPLWRLNHLMNIDKHKTLALTHVFAREALGDLTHPTYERLQTPRIAFDFHLGEIVHDGAEVLSIQFGDLGDPEKMEMQLNTALSITFTEPSLGDVSVDVLIGDLVKFVKDRVIRRFKPLF